MITVLIFIGLAADGSAVAIPASTWQGFIGRSQCDAAARVRNTAEARPAAFVRPAHYPPITSGTWHCIPVASPA